MGNHDSQYKYPNATAPYVNIFSLPPNGPPNPNKDALDSTISVKNYYFDYANARIIAIDSNAAQFDPKNPNSLADWNNKITPWLSGLVQDPLAPTWKFVFFHHPAFSSAQHGCDERQAFTDQIRTLLSTTGIRDRIDIVFYGHDHDYEYIPAQTIKGVVTTKPFYIVTGMGGNDDLDNSVCDGKCNPNTKPPCDCTECAFAQSKCMPIDPADCIKTPNGGLGSCYGGCYYGCLNYPATTSCPPPGDPKRNPFSFTLVTVSKPNGVDTVQVQQITQDGSVVFDNTFPHLPNQ